MNREKEIRMKGVLLLKGDANWDYYLYNNTVYSIANDDYCEDEYFGKIDHIKKLYRNGMVKGTLTNTGRELIVDRG